MQATTGSHELGAAIKEAGSIAPGKAIILSGLRGSSRAYFLAEAFTRLKRPFFGVLPDEEAATEFAEDLRFFLPEKSVLFYPSTEVLPFEPEGAHHDIIASRLEGPHRLISGG